MSLIGKDNMIKLYEHYKGQAINFPAKIYSKEYIRAIILEKYDGNNAREIARETGYSERWIKQVIKLEKVNSTKR